MMLSIDNQSVSKYLRALHRGRSSAGRARGWQPRGQGFDPPRLHTASLKLRSAGFSEDEGTSL